MIVGLLEGASRRGPSDTKITPTTHSWRMYRDQGILTTHLEIRNQGKRATVPLESIVTKPGGSPAGGWIPALNIPPAVLMQVNLSAPLAGPSQYRDQLWWSSNAEMGRLEVFATVMLKEYHVSW